MKQSIIDAAKLQVSQRREAFTKALTALVGMLPDEDRQAVLVKMHQAAIEASSKAGGMLMGALAFETSATDRLLADGLADVLLFGHIEEVIEDVSESLEKDDAPRTTRGRPAP